MPAQFPIIFVIAAIVLIAIAKGGKKDKKARSLTTQLPDVHQPSDVLTIS